MSMDELANVKGRGWEDIDVRGMSIFLFARSTLTDSNRSTEKLQHDHKRHGSLDTKVI
jgi:hypothetical protein